MLALALLLASPAQALTSHQSGPALDLAAGLGLGGAPLRASVGGEVSLGWWLGVYDDQYAFGRYWWLGATGHVDWRPDALAIVPMVEVRRGLELIVAGLYIGAGGGLVLVPEVPEPGWTGRLSVGAKFRRSRFFGLTLRLEGGVDVRGDAVGFGGGALLGVAFARPARAITAPQAAR